MPMNFMDWSDLVNAPESLLPRSFNADASPNS